jgi:hypothetical protein
MFTAASRVRLCSVSVTIGMAVISAVGCGAGGSPTRPGSLSGTHSGPEIAATTTPAASATSATDTNFPVTPELAAVRQATVQFHDLAVARAAGYTTENEPCVASPLGAMGIHAPNLSLIGDPALDPARPELLLYAPAPNGGYKLVGVEYFRAVLLRNIATGEIGPRFESAEWDPAAYELLTPRPELFGQAFQLDPPPAPHVPWHWSLHVWIWAHNPSGMFAEWNPSIACN